MWVMEEEKSRAPGQKHLKRVDVIIPAYRPGKKFSRLLKML